MAILEVALLIAVVFGLAFFSASVWIWSSVLFVLLGLETHYGYLSDLSLSVFWLLYLIAFCFANLKAVRLRYFTLPLAQYLQKTMPSISRTEREAIEAGDVWWEKELFCGRPRFKKLFAIPKPKLTSEEEHFINNQVETLCNQLDDWRILNVDHDLSPKTWEYIKAEKFWGMVIDKAYGGLGFSALAHSTVISKIASRSVSAAVTVMVPNSLGPGELITHYGTEEQKNYYLPRLAEGKEIPCFALTGLEAGSDAGSITDNGIVCRGNYEGKEVLGIRLNWEKRYITLAPVATVLGLAFKLHDPDKLLGSQTDLGITLCLVPTHLPGVEIGNRHLPLHLAFMNGPTRGKDVFIPLDFIIGGIEMAGQGWRMLMECLSIGRGISLPALSTACSKLAYRLTGAYARIRRQFNTSISNFEGIQEALGEIAGFTYTIEACRIMTAGSVDLKIRPAIVSAIAKYHMTEMNRVVCNHAMDIQGGHGIQMGPRNFTGHSYMAIPMSITVEGANILTRNLIIFGQGAIRCHPYLLREIEMLSSEGSDHYPELNRLLLSHVGYFISNLVRNFYFGFTAGKLQWPAVRGKTAKWYRQITRMSSALSMVSDLSMLILGGNLKRRENISARLGDILSHLYLASAVLKYYEDLAQPETDLENVEWSVTHALYQIQLAFNELFDNFPIKMVGKILSFLIFPYGPAYSKPSDALYHRVVNRMLSPSDFRDRLTKYTYLSEDQKDPAKRVDIAFGLRDQLEPVLKKFYQAIKQKEVSDTLGINEQLDAALSKSILSAYEARALKEYFNIEREVIQVNEFSFNLESIIH